MHQISIEDYLWNLVSSLTDRDSFSIHWWAYDVNQLRKWPR